MLGHEIFLTLQIEEIHLLLEGLPVWVIGELIFIHLVDGLFNFGWIERLEPGLKLGLGSGFQGDIDLLESDVVQKESIVGCVIEMV